MGKIRKTTISFDKKFLNKLKEDLNSCVHIQKDVKRLPIHPFRLIDINTCVKDIFQKKIAKYDEKLNGILLGYQNVTLLDSDHETFDGSFTYLDIEAEFYVFRPVIGSILNGIVNKKSKDHVGCLVYNTFNVTLPRPQDEETWLGEKIQIGNEVQFKIICTDMDSRLPFIKGVLESIISYDSGFGAEDSFLEQNTKIKFNNSEDDELEELDKNICSKTKEKINFNSIQEEGVIGEGSSKKLSKKHKKTKNRELENLSQEEHKIHLTEEIKVKKKRKSKEISLHFDNLEENERSFEVEENEEIYVKKSKRKRIKSISNEDEFLPSKEIDHNTKKHKRDQQKNADLSKVGESEEKEVVKKSSKRKKDKNKSEDNLTQEIDEEFNYKLTYKKDQDKKEPVKESFSQNQNDAFLETLTKEIVQDLNRKGKKSKKDKIRNESVDEELYQMEENERNMKSKREQMLTQEFDVEYNLKKKKHKKDKEKHELINEELNQIEENEDVQTVKRKKHKSKNKEDKDEFLKSLMHDIDDEFDQKIKKNKKHNKKKELETDDFLKMGENDEIKKSEKKKDKSGDDEFLDDFKMIDEDIDSNLKKHKKKKKKKD